jgi:hypothetical protein
MPFLLVFARSPVGHAASKDGPMLKPFNWAWLCKLLRITNAAMRDFFIHCVLSGVKNKLLANQVRTNNLNFTTATSARQDGTPIIMIGRIYYDGYTTINYDRNRS